MENKTLVASLVSVVVQAIVLQAVLVPIVDELGTGQQRVKVVISNDEYIKSYAVEATGTVPWSISYDTDITVTYGDFIQTISASSQPTILLTSDSACVYMNGGQMKAVGPEGRITDATSVSYNGTAINVNSVIDYDKPTKGYIALGLGEGAKSIQTKAIYDMGCGALHDSDDVITVIGTGSTVYGQSTQTVKNFDKGKQSGEIRTDDGEYDAKGDVTVTKSDENYTVDDGKIEYNC